MKLFAKKPIPHSFILDELDRLGVHTKAMFGCTAIYHADKILLVLRERASNLEDNGIWVATYQEFHETLKKDLPSLRSIRIFGPGETDWQVLPSDSLSFEDEAFKVCEMIMRGDHRIGRIPKAKLPRKKSVGAKKAPTKRKISKKPAGPKKTRASSQKKKTRKSK